MSTREFIEKCVNGLVSGTKRVSSVMYDGINVYSYGKHYPLLIKTSKGFVLNDTGYSHTTAKHISWARPYAIGAVKLTHGECYDRYTMGIELPTENGVLQAISNEMQELNEKRYNLSQRAFKQKAEIEQRLNDLQTLKTLLS